MIRKYECKYTSYVVYKVPTDRKVLLLRIAGALSVEDVMRRTKPVKELDVCFGLLLGG